MRPRLPIGTAGDIACSTADSGTVTARARFRDWDGVTRLVQASGRTRSAAERALKEKLASRAEYRPGTSDLTRDSTFKDLADYWLADMEGNPDLAPGTKRLYRWNMTHLVLPEFEHRTLREIGRAAVRGDARPVAGIDVLGRDERPGGSGVEVPRHVFGLEGVG